MSLSNVNVLSGIQFDVTPNGGGTTSRTYIAQNVQILERWFGQTWQTSDFVNHVNTEARHLIFRLSGEDVTQIGNIGDKRSITSLDQDLKDVPGYTVELYPEASQSKKFQVIAFEPSDRVIAAFEDQVRSDAQEINCITKNKVSRSDVEWFRKFG